MRAIHKCDIHMCDIHMCEQRGRFDPLVARFERLVSCVSNINSNTV